MSRLPIRTAALLSLLLSLLLAACSGYAPPDAIDVGQCGSAPVPAPGSGSCLMRRGFMFLKFDPLNETLAKEGQSGDCLHCADRGHAPANILKVTISAFCAALILLACAPTDPLLRQAIEEVQKRPSSGRIKLRPFAVQGNATAITQICIAYGRSLSSDVGAQERENAFAWCSQAAISGHAEAQYHLGNFYAWGIGTPEDRDLALRWYAQAANHGHAAAEDAQRGVEGKSAVCRNLITGCRLF